MDVLTWLPLTPWPLDSQRSPDSLHRWVPCLHENYHHPSASDVAKTSMRQWAWTILCWKAELFFLIVQLVSRPSNAAKALKKREEKKKNLGRFLYFMQKRKKFFSFFFFYHYQNLLQTHRPYSIPIKLYRASPALDCQRGPSVLIYRPRKHSTIMVINNNRIQYVTTWMMEALRIHLRCFVLQSSCL